MKKRLAGRYIVTDLKVCHGQPTFRGTRILVADVLEQVASGIAWESIVAKRVPTQLNQPRATTANTPGFRQFFGHRPAQRQ